MTSRSKPLDPLAAGPPSPDPSEPASVHVCARCGQTTIGAACDCAPADPRHETLRLFTPAPEQMPGQTTIAGIDPH